VCDAPCLSACFERAMEQSRPSPQRPWSLAIAWDEFCPGNKLQVEPSRKIMVLSFTFLELGQGPVSGGLAWATPVVVRTTVLRQIIGGWPNLLRRFLNRILLGANGLATSGFPLQLASGAILPVFARVTNLLSDGEGLRMGLDWKGHASFKPCFRHYNVWMKDRCT
jgi:hypothetical protein